MVVVFLFSWFFHCSAPCDSIYKWNPGIGALRATTSPPWSRNMVPYVRSGVFLFITSASGPPTPSTILALAGGTPRRAQPLTRGDARRLRCRAGVRRCPTRLEARPSRSRVRRVGSTPRLTQRREGGRMISIAAKWLEQHRLFPHSGGAPCRRVRASARRGARRLVRNGLGTRGERSRGAPAVRVQHRGAPQHGRRASTGRGQVHPRGPAIAGGAGPSARGHGWQPRRRVPGKGAGKAGTAHEQWPRGGDPDGASTDGGWPPGSTVPSKGTDCLLSSARNTKARRRPGMLALGSA